MKICDLFKTKKLVLSYEIFPPKATYPIDVIYDTLEQLKGLTPDYVSVTYSAGGSGNGNRTLELAKILKNKYKITPLAHITCAHSSAEEIENQITKMTEIGVENVLALRGDIRPDVPRSKDFLYASDLVKFILKRADVNVVGACYPEGHFECESLDLDVENLKKKVDAGVTHLNSQLFFDNTDFYNFIEKARKSGITVPIQAGIMPITNVNQVKRTVTMAGVKIPAPFAKLLAKYGDKPDSLKAAGIAYACSQLVDLIANDVQGVHLYIMNNGALAKTLTDNVYSIVKDINEEK